MKQKNSENIEIKPIIEKSNTNDVIFRKADKENTNTAIDITEYNDNTTHFINSNDYNILKKGPSRTYQQQFKTTLEDTIRQSQFLNW